jgi:N-acetylneuraminic acid mutarotase
MPASPLPAIVLLAGAVFVAGCGDTPTSTQPGDAPAMTAFAAPVAAVLPTTNTWVARAAMTATGERKELTAGMVPNPSGQSIVYAIGGEDCSDECGWGFFVSAYNTVTDVWTSKHTTAQFGRASNGVAKIGNKLYYSGGTEHDGTGDISVNNALVAYDYTQDTDQRLAPMPRPTADGVTGVINNIMYVLPGTCGTRTDEDPHSCDHVPFRRLFRYNPASNAWGTRRESPHFHIDGAGAAINGKFYVAGGTDSAGKAVRQLDAYDPATERWTTLAPLPAGGRAVGTALGSKLYVILGDHRLFVYNPATNTWTTKRALPAATDPQAAVRVLINNQLYLFVIGVSNQPTQLYRP